MSPKVLRQCLDAEPFVPLNISLMDHSAYFIANAKEATLTEDGSALLITQRDERILVSVAQIVSIRLESSSGKFFGFGPLSEKLR